MTGGDLLDDTRFPGFNLLPKLDNWQHNGSGRPVISNCDYLTEQYLSLIDYHFQSQAKNLLTTFLNSL